MESRDPKRVDVNTYRLKYRNVGMGSATEGLETEMSVAYLRRKQKQAQGRKGGLEGS